MDADKAVPMTAKYPPDDVVWAEDFAKEMDMSRSAVLRRALRAFRARHQEAA